MSHSGTIVHSARARIGTMWHNYALYYLIGLAGCSATPVTALVTVEEANLPPIVQIGVDFSFSGRTATRTLPAAPGGPLVFPTTFSATFPDGADRLDLTVRALDGTGMQVGCGIGGAPLEPHQVVSLAVLLGARCAQMDGGVPDLSGPDLSTLPDLVPPPDIALPCGALGGRCCAGHPSGGHAADFCTDPGSACQAAMCIPCGADGQPCCDGNSCGGGGGPVGCCDHAAGPRGVCIADGNQCPNGLGACKAGVCGTGLAACGDETTGPCPGGTGCTAPATVSSAMDTACVPCGAQIGQACCYGTNGGVCQGMIACNSAGTCDSCGGPAHPCCKSSTCIAPNVCMQSSGDCATP